MTDASVSLDKWRGFFRSSNSDIFNVIEHAIMVAACDYPYDFKLKRDRIAEMLFVSNMTKCYGCDSTDEHFVINCDGVESNGDKAKLRAGESKDTDESKVDNSRGGDDYDESREAMKSSWNHVSHCGFGDAEALTDEIDKEFKVVEEVVRIKEILDHKDEKSAEVLFDSLRQLQLMHISLETLKVTGIGKSVKVLRKHMSKEIQNLVTTLTEDWRIMIDVWVRATTAITRSGEAETESITMTAEDEEGGLPSPPLDEGAFFTTTASMELSKFFDCMDDDGNLGNSGAFNKNQENRRKTTLEKRDVPKSKLKDPRNSSIPPNCREVENKKNQEVTLKKQTLEPNRPQNGGSRLAKPKPEYTETRLTKPKLHYTEVQVSRQNPPSNQSRPTRPKPAVQPRIKSNIKIQQKPDTDTIQKKPVPLKQYQKLDFNNEASVQINLEVAKRKLQERYQAAENAKRQRTIQVVELHDLPKKGFAPRKNQHTKTGVSNKHRPKLRR